MAKSQQKSNREQKKPKKTDAQKQKDSGGGSAYKQGQNSTAKPGLMKN